MQPEVAVSKTIQVPRGGRAFDLRLIGHKDRRGLDAHVFIWVDEDGKLHIRATKPGACYQFEETIEEQGYVEIVSV